MITGEQKQKQKSAPPATKEEVENLQQRNCINTLKEKN
jgi:hypothetical protein